MKHSPLGFSGAERWAHCPGSVALIASLPAGSGESDEEYTKAGTAAHAAAAWCLREGVDAWEAGDQEWEGYKLDEDDLRSVQVYLNDIRSRPMIGGYIEEHIAAPEIHSLAFGTLDFFWVSEDWHAEITDYKHGVGIWVSPDENWQLMGYAVLLLSKYPQIEHFRLRIVQPRCEPYEGPREWEISAADLRKWADEELYPAMWAAGEDDQHLNPGPWCRFCKAQKAIACPAILDTIPAVVEAASRFEEMSDEVLGLHYQKIEPAKMAMKSIETEVERRRLQLGRDIPGSKTVVKRAFRVWKDDAGETANACGLPYFETVLRSPPEVEKLPGGKAFVKQHAYTPDNGYTIAPLSDRRHPVQIQSIAAKYGLDAGAKK